MFEKNNKLFLRIISGLLCLHFLNISIDIDFRPFFNNTNLLQAHDMNDIESVIEVVYEAGTGNEMKDVTDETSPLADYDDQSSVKALDKFFSGKTTALKPTFINYLKETFVFSDKNTEQHISEINPPPPKV